MPLSGLPKRLLVLALVAAGAFAAMRLYEAAGPQSAFVWYARESAPRDYPMRIVRGDLIYPDGGSIYIPDDRVVHNGWGDGKSLHGVGPDMKPAPEKLSTTWFSYPEDKFYSGTWDLPYDKMLAMFRSKVLAGFGDRHASYTNIIVGVAPEGHVSVWMNASGTITKVTQFKAEEADLPWTVIYPPDAPIGRAELVQGALESSLEPDQLARLKEEGVPPDLFDRRAVRYSWTVEFITSAFEVRCDKTFHLNGERFYHLHPPSEPRPTHHATPWRFSVMRQVGMRCLGPDVILDPDEVLLAFEKMSGGDTNRPMHLKIYINDEQTVATAFLYVDNLVLQLENVTITP